MAWPEETAVGATGGLTSHKRKGESRSGNELYSAFILGRGDWGPQDPALPLATSMTFHKGLDLQASGKLSRAREEVFS